MDCRLLVQDCSGKEVSTHLVNAYARVGSKSRNEWDAFFADPEASIASAATRDTVVIGGDFNSSIGVDPTATMKGAQSQYHPRGPFGVDYTNESGKRLLRWMKTPHLAAVSTYFKKKRYATWTNFGHDRRSYQSDHFLVLGKDTRRVLDQRIHRRPPPPCIL
jgi:hypothetical protein